MTGSTRAFAGTVLAASIAVLGAALLSQYWGGLAPCELCLLQRWPWDAAIAISAIAVVFGGRVALPWLAGLLTLVFAVSTVLAFYHVGVEQHWFAGPSTCTSNAGNGAATIDQLRLQLMHQAPVLCDRVAWSLFGVSLAGWNLLASLMMTAYCLAAVRRGLGVRGPGPLRRGTA